MLSIDLSNTDILTQAQKWHDMGHKVVLATVIDTWGSAPQPVGSQLIVNDSYEMLGSVSGGCIEAAVVHEAQHIMKDYQPRLLTYSVSDDTAWSVGLTCGGTITIYVDIIE